MKTSAFLALSVALSFAAVAGPVQSQTRAGGLEPLRIVSQRDLPVYPARLIQMGVREGMAKIAFSVNTQGQLDDCLAVAYTHPEFAQVTTAAIRRWAFQPAYYRGEPVASVTEVTVSFHVEGPVVVSMTPQDTFDAMIYALVGPDSLYRAHGLSELDRVPTAIATVSPRYPVELASRIGSGEVTVLFYIDEAGAVRLPCVNAVADPELASLAVEAMQQWRFEPPTCDGRPVLVKAEQVFRFNAPIRETVALASAD